MALASDSEFGGGPLVYNLLFVRRGRVRPVVCSLSARGASWALSRTGRGVKMVLAVLAVLSWAFGALGRCYRVGDVRAISWRHLSRFNTRLDLHHVNCRRDRYLEGIRFSGADGRTAPDVRRSS